MILFGKQPTCTTGEFHRLTSVEVTSGTHISLRAGRRLTWSGMILRYVDILIKRNDNL